MKKDDKVIFHNTQLLLEHYRDVVWSLEVSVFQTNVNFQAEFGNTIEEFLELSYEAGLDLPASDVAARIRSINKSRNMLRIIDSAVALLRKTIIEIIISIGGIPKAIVPIAFLVALFITPSLICSL